MTDASILRLGTRRSPLARWQAEWVAGQLRQLGLVVELVLIETTGDLRRGPIAQLAGQGVFTGEIQRALLVGDIDLAVHSLKDLPTEPVPGLRLAAVPVRAAAGDALLTQRADSFQALPPGSTIATGSLRRRAQLLAVRPDLRCVDVRGNVDTRLGKLEAGEFDALVLAEAGLERLALAGHIVEKFDLRVMLPAVGQGALGLEVRADDDQSRDAVKPLNDADSLAAVIAERALLAQLRAGCLAPVGAWGRICDGRLVLDAAVLSLDGRQRRAVQCEGSPGEAEEIGRAGADELLRQGAGELIAASRTPQ